MNPRDVVEYIEGEPKIGVVPTEPGLTNINGERVVGMNTENTEINEGTINFDIVFYVRMKDGLSQIIVNVEAQKDMPTEYHILNRAIFYACRLVSSSFQRTRFQVPGILFLLTSCRTHGCYARYPTALYIFQSDRLTP